MSERMLLNPNKNLKWIDDRFFVRAIVIIVVFELLFNTAKSLMPYPFILPKYNTKNSLTHIECAKKCARLLKGLMML